MITASSPSPAANVVWHAPKVPVPPRAPQPTRQGRVTAKGPRPTIPSLAEFTADPERFSEEEIDVLIGMVKRERVRWTLTRAIWAALVIGLHLWALLYLPLYLLGKF